MNLPQSLSRIRASLTAKSRATIVSALALLLVFSAAAQALAQELDTIEPGKLIVGFNGDMPMTSLQDGQLIGTDGKMIAKIAADLGLEIVPRRPTGPPSSNRPRPAATTSCSAPWAGPSSAPKS